MAIDGESDILNDDILEEERADKLAMSVGDDELPEDNDPPATDEPDMEDGAFRNKTGGGHKTFDITPFDGTMY